MITVVQLCGEGIHWIKQAEYQFVINRSKVSINTGGTISPRLHREDKLIFKKDK